MCFMMTLLKGQKPKHVGLTIKLFFILQVLLEFWPLQTSLCSLEVGEVVPETPTLLKKVYLKDLGCDCCQQYLQFGHVFQQI